jgi:hypothetical protein
MKIVTCFIYSVALVIGLTSYAWSDWQLYDDFNSGSIDLQKWEIDDSSATITVENGKAKFVHQSGYPLDSSFLIFKNPANIIGIKATISVQAIDGDVRVRLASFLGNYLGDYYWTAHEIRGDRDYISSSLAILGPPPQYDFRSDFFWGSYAKQIPIVGQSFTMSMVLSQKQADYEVEGQGGLQFYFPVTLDPPDDKFKGIGTRSHSGAGTCTVYFDDVYIMRKAGAPAVNLLLLD